MASKISIHAPAKGATSPKNKACKQSMISIHAPAKGATLGSVAVCYFRCISIHAPAKGATLLQKDLRYRKGFQSTLPRRERRCFDAKTEAGLNFNPRSREGSDAFFTQHRKLGYISIHAPAKGATLAHGFDI